MILQIDFLSIGRIYRRLKGLLISIIVNCLIKAFTMVLLAMLFMGYIFAPWISADLAE